ncbi:hypothetical protein V500_08749 [Pseudogymnoascus sp. VKM F-4518 (FW-2643)]|nr:hypothetical protein V500_08749 [Pseudogymnoascus sp. VKM F-4518 (FW-2643)]
MRFTAALISALFVATGLAAPILEAKDAAAAELDARYRGCVVDNGCMKACALVGINPGLCAPSCTLCP